MSHLRHIVVASVAGAVLSFGLVGCESEQRPDFIPSSAQLMDSGNGKIHYTAPDDGMVYIYDHQQTKLVWSGNILKGESLDVDPTKNQVIANGALVTMKTLNAGDINDIYFVTAPVVNSTPAPANNANNNYNGVTVTPSVSVQPSNGGQPANSVNVQPGLNVSPTPAPTNPAAAQ